MKRKLLILTVSLFCLLPVISQSTYYVRETGEDVSGQSGDESQPFKTLHYAVTRCAASGDTINALGTFITNNVSLTMNADKSVSIVGHGPESTIIQPAETAEASTNRVFSINNTKLVLKNLTVRWGNAGTANGGIISCWQSELEAENVVFSEAKAAQGGAIHIAGTSTVPVTFNNCVFDSNTATDRGAAINVLGVRSMPVTITDCTISNNTATNYGAGLAFAGAAGTETSIVKIYNSLISNNKTTATNTKGGAGMYMYIANNATTPLELNVYNSTFAFNETPTSSAVLATSSNTTIPQKVTLWNNTIAYNRGNATADITNLSGPGIWFPYATSNISLDMVNNLCMENWGKVYGSAPGHYDITVRYLTLTRIIHNIFTNTIPQYYIQNPKNADPGNTNIYNNNAAVKLATNLADNGGKTQTLALEVGSVAINSGLSFTESFMMSDQRGFTRIGSSFDIGAYEYEGTNPTTELSKNQVEKIAFYDKNSRKIVIKGDSANVIVFDISGRKVIESNKVASSISVEQLANNRVYIVIIKLNNGLHNAIKFIK